MALLVYPKKPIFNHSRAYLDVGHPLAKDLIGYWPCDDGGGALVRDLLGRAPGAIIGSNYSWGEGPQGPILLLNASGSSSYIKVPISKTTGDLNAGLTLSLWLNWTASTEGYNSLFSNEADGGNWTWLLTSGQTVSLYNNGAGADPIGASTIPFGVWVHLVMVFYGTNNQNCSIFYNGIQLETHAFTSLGGSAATFTRICGGAPFGSGRYIKGNIRDVGMWQRPLTSPEILDLANIPGILLKSKKIYVGTSSGSPTAINLTESDQLSLSDSVQLNSLPFVDSIVLSDAFNLVNNLLISVNDSISLSDAITDWVGIPEVFSDGFLWADSFVVQPLAVITLAISDAISLSDAFTEFTSNPLLISDQIVLQDQIKLSSLFMAQLIDQLSLTDFVQILLAPIANLSPSDSFTFTDAISVMLLSIFTAVNLSFNDTLVLNDLVSLSYQTGLQFSDGFMFSDAIRIVMGTSLNPYLRRYLNDVPGVSNP